MKAKKTSSRKQSGSGKRGVKDLPTRKSHDVKGGFRWDIKPNKSVQRRISCGSIVPGACGAPGPAMGPGRRTAPSG